jgi:hypothetical protein
MLRPVNILAALCFSVAFTFVAKGGSNLVTFAPVPQGTNVDLTAEGKSDWVHWGLFTESSLNRKAGVPPLITDFTVQVPTGGSAVVFQYADNFNGYSWADGFPEASATNTPTGVWAYGIPRLGSGFMFAVPADTTPRTLKVYVGVFAGGGTFETWLSDNSAPIYVDTTLTNPSNGPGGVYTIEFSADSPGQLLMVRWTLTSQHDPTANVTLQAATLSTAGANNPPIVSLSAPTNNATFPYGAPISLRPSVMDLDGFVSLVEFYDGATKIGEATTSPFQFEWNGAEIGRHSLVVRAVDDAGTSRTSAPVDIFVFGSGGRLTGSRGSPAGSVDLTGEGSVDWVHWGLLDATSINRKATLAPQIGDLTIIGNRPPARYADSPSTFAWTDGTPTPLSAGTSTGWLIGGFTNGFRITVPAGPDLHTLKVYVGLYGAAGNFQAFLSDGCAPPYTDTSLDSIYDKPHAVYSLDYSATFPGQTLTVEYRSARLYDMDFGNVTWQAAALHRPRLAEPIRLVNARTVNGFFQFDLPTQSGIVYTVQFTSDPGMNSWQTLTVVVGDGTLITVNDPELGSSQRFYRIRIP